MKTLITGGSGFFGSYLVDHFLKENLDVANLDLNPPDTEPARRVWIAGDIRSQESIANALKGIDQVIHCAALVPLAKNKKGFAETNAHSTILLLNESRKAGVKKFQYISSSAVYGCTEDLPVNENSNRAPFESYGKAKLAGELACEALRKSLGPNPEMQIGVIRPRTILGHGRLGIFEILFNWIQAGTAVPVLNGGKNVYQFVHAQDLLKGCVLALEQSPNEDFNFGAKEYGTLFESLSGLCTAVGSKSKIISFPRWLVEPAIHLSGWLGIAPLGAYHAVMYGRSLYFDNHKAQTKLGWIPKYSNVQMLVETYQAFLNQNRDSRGMEETSLHKAGVQEGVLGLMKRLGRS